MYRPIFDVLELLDSKMYSVNENIKFIREVDGKETTRKMKENLEKRSPRTHDVDWHGSTSFARWYYQSAAGYYNDNQFFPVFNNINIPYQTWCQFIGGKVSLPIDANTELISCDLDVNLTKLIVNQRLSYIFTTAPNFANFPIITDDTSSRKLANDQVKFSKRYEMRVGGKREDPFVPNRENLENAKNLMDCLVGNKVLRETSVGRSSRNISVNNLLNEINTIFNTKNVTTKELDNKIAGIASTVHVRMFTQCCEIFAFFQRTMREISKIDNSTDMQLAILMGYGMWSHVLDQKHLLHFLFGIFNQSFEREPYSNMYTVNQIEPLVGGQAQFIEFLRLIGELDQNQSFNSISAILFKRRLLETKDLLISLKFQARKIPIQPIGRAQSPARPHKGKSPKGSKRAASPKRAQSPVQKKPRVQSPVRVRTTRAGAPEIPRETRQRR